jgi:plasmid stabilization system protein ParE
MLRILKQARAEDDLVDIWLYSLEKWGGNQADLYLDKLGEGIISIAHNPAIGKDYGFTSRII